MRQPRQCLRHPVLQIVHVQFELIYKKIRPGFQAIQNIGTAVNVVHHFLERMDLGEIDEIRPRTCRGRPGDLTLVLNPVFRQGDVSKIIDISKSGLSFLTPQEFLRNDILQMIFRLPPDFKEKIEILGRVVESVPTVQRGFKTRVSFINVDPGAKTMLSQMIEKSSTK